MHVSMLPPLTIRTDKQLSSLKINEDDIKSIIKSLSSNKSHGWDKFSIKMIKMCNKTFVYPLKLIFQTVVPIEKKKVKIFENYRPISLLLFFLQNI